MDKEEIYLFNIPIWVFAVILLIFLCGVMAFRAIRADYKVEQKFIEQEGSKYINRMEEERYNRAHQNERIAE